MFFSLHFRVVAATVWGAIITTTSTTVPFNYNEAPIELEPEPVLMEGATTAEAEAAALDETSAELPLINGGVVLASESTSTVDGQERLAQILSTPPDEVVAVVLDLSNHCKYLGGAFFVVSCSFDVHKLTFIRFPFTDCAGMNGRDCCLAIKH